MSIRKIKIFKKTKRVKVTILEHSFRLCCILFAQQEVTSASPVQKTPFLTWIRDPNMAKARSSSQANSAEESHSHITDQMEPALDSQNVSLNENISSPKGPTTRSIVAWDAAIACKNDSTVNMSNSEDGVRSSCPVDSATGNTSDQQVLSPADGHEKGLSMKHLTCFFWWENGHCKYSEDHCLYSHTDTGRVADAPTQIEPGGRPDHCILLIVV